MKTPLIFFKNKHPWQWPSCKHPKTLSFRASPTVADNIFKTTVNSIFLDTSQSHLENSETIVRDLHPSDTQRLFFETGYTSSSIVKGETTIDKKREATMVVMESNDPYSDFKKSMAEMIENHRLINKWDCLEELLVWYLKMNSSDNHSFIVAAFLDLLLTTSSSSSSSYSSAKSCFSE